MRKTQDQEETVPVTVRVPTSTVKWIDDWRRAQRVIPSRSQFLRQAVEEKIGRKQQPKKPALG